MAITEKRRHDLFHRAAEVFGPAEAETMMELIGPAKWSELASRTDLADMGGDLRTDMVRLRVDLGNQMGELRTELRGEMAELRTDLRTEMAELRTDLRTEMADLRTDLRTEMADLRTDVEARFSAMTKTFVTWMLASQAAFTTLVAVFITVAH